jgi:hypothetical protein
MQRADKAVLAQLRASQTALNARLKALAARPGFSNSIREAQLRLAKREIQLEMANLFRKIGDITSAMRLEAAARVLNVNQHLDAFKLLGAGLPDGPDIARAIADAELDAARSGLDRMIARVQGSSYNALSQRVYTAASGLNGPISTLVNTALASGLSAREFASAAKDFINPNTPGGFRYAAYRLARTEINNAAHAIAVDSVQDKPWVSGMKWHLSGSHPRVDICNSLASGGPKNDGIYPKTGVPAKPHPHCFCFVTPETPDDEEFLDNLIDGHYDQYLEKYRNIKSGEIISTRNFRAVAPTPKPPVVRPATPLRAVKSVPVTPKAAPVAPDPHPGLSAMPKHAKFLRGEREVIDEISELANGSRDRFLSSIDFQINCQQVVQAAELRHRGFDVMAKAVRKDYSNLVVGDGWTYPDGTIPKIQFGQRLSDLQSELAGYKEGERAWVMCVWNSGGSHIFNVAVENGRIVWYDGQNQNVLAREKPGVPSPQMAFKNKRVSPAHGWGIIKHTETLIPDDRVLQNIERHKLR